MSNAVIGLMFALGVAAWVFNKTQRRTGGNTQNALIVAGLIGLLAFLAMLTFLGFVV